MLDARQRQRYARHLLLVEIGEAGQARLNAAQVRMPAAADPRAVAVARDYLERAGLAVQATEARGSALEACVLDPRCVQALAGSVELEQAAAALAGAFAAVEAIKAALGVGMSGRLPHGLSLDTEDGS